MDTKQVEWLMRFATVRQLVARIESIPASDRRFTPFPPEWEISPSLMIQLVDAGYLGMDGFRYCFREYAEQCWRVCHR